MKLKDSFYLRSNVVRVAKELLGKVLFTEIGGALTSGIIVETEAYSQKERGCHAHKGKTSRNAVMFANGGVAYIYLCYGIHPMFNVVTNKSGVADAVLVRAVEPQLGQGTMMQRAKAKTISRITSGPGKLCKAMGIDKQLNNNFLIGDAIWIEEQGINIPATEIAASTRIGIDYAGEDALLPWRFSINGNVWVSKPW